MILKMNPITIFIAVSTNDLRQFDPLPFLNRCGNAFLKSPYSGGLAFISNLNYIDRNVTHIIHTNSTEPSVSQPGDPSTNYEKNMAYRKVVSIRYFLEHTNAPFFGYISEDTHIYVENLYKLFYSLIHELKINPLKDPLVKGNCLRFNTGHPFIQGGSGYIFSRRSAQDFLKVEQKWRDEYKGKGPEDYAFSDALQMMNYSLGEISSPYFLGQYCARKDKPYLEAETISQTYLDDLPLCPRHLKNPPSEPNTCKLDYVRFKDIVFLHRLSDLRPWSEYKPLSHYPDNLYYTMHVESVALCMHRDIMGKVKKH